MKIYYKALVSILVLLCVTCMEPYEPSIEEYENLLVVDGLLTNLPGPYKIHLSRTYSLLGINDKKVRDADVKIMDNRGNEYLLHEEEAGTYMNNDMRFQGKIGNSYKLMIITAEGEKYESEFQELLKPTEIDSIYFKYEPRSIYDILGVQIYINANDESQNTRYFTWVYHETWEFHIPFPLPDRQDLSICYKSNSSNEIMIGKLEGENSQFMQYPLYYISYETDRLRRKYSTLVTQYSINEEAYEFLKNLKSINEEVGTLYDTPPASLVGNIYNTNNPDELVLGFFMVAGGSTKRLFIESSEIPQSYNVKYAFDDCKTVNIGAQDTVLLQHLLNTGWVFHSAEPDWLIYVNSAKCYDCSITGSVKVPEFWE